MKDTDFSFSDLSLKEAWSLVKTFLTYSLGCLVITASFYGLEKAGSAVGLSASLPDWLTTVLHGVVLVLVAIYLIRLLEISVSLYVGLAIDILVYIRAWSLLTRILVVFSVWLSWKLGFFCPPVGWLLCFGVFIPALGVIEEFNSLRYEKLRECGLDDVEGTNYVSALSKILPERAWVFLGEHLDKASGGKWGNWRDPLDDPTPLPNTSLRLDPGQ